MTKENPFVLSPSQYKRDLSFLKHYVEDTASYLSTMTGSPKKECMDYVKAQLRAGGKFEFKDPKINYLERNEHGDREKKEGTLLTYIAKAVQNDRLIAPTFTIYANPNEKKSLLVDYIDGNVAKRSKAKKEMFAAKMAGQKVLQLFKNGEQANKKILNNSISGGHVSKSTPLHNRTGHSTLTSNCRTTSGYGNANNEKLLSGNRHYHHPTIVFNSIASIVVRTNLIKLQAVMDKYHLHYPTAREAYECAFRSFSQYWRSATNEKRLKEYFIKLTPIERAAFCYVGDLYHIKKFNDSFMRSFIGGIASRVDAVDPDPKATIKHNRPEYLALVTQFYDEMKGKQIHSVENDPIYAMLAANVSRVHEHTVQHADFIEAIFVTENVPSSLGYFPNSIRHSALTSDTDSTIFTVMDWVIWFTGTHAVNVSTTAVSATMIFIAAEAITHILAKMSANFGVETKRIHDIAMKNEYRFDIFVPTMVGKHYFALIGCQEGNLLAKYDLEIKGVQLKSSNVAKSIINTASEMMRAIMETVLKGESIKILPYLKQIGDIERGVVESIIKGERTYLRSGQVKDAASYKGGEENSPFQHYTFWNSVFAKKYGSSPPPPYTCAKVAISLKNQNAVAAWIETVEDPAIKASLLTWNEQYKKAGMNMMLIPNQCLESHGIPSEIVPILDIRRSILDVSRVFYLIMEALGFHCLNDKMTRLISDSY